MQGGEAEVDGEDVQGGEIAIDGRMFLTEIGRDLQRPAVADIM